jgi:hypothetical protein
VHAAGGLYFRRNTECKRWSGAGGLIRVGLVRTGLFRMSPTAKI